MTPNLNVFIDFVESLPEAQYIRHLGITNCRRISGSQTYSQHSWSNAVDIHFTNDGSPAVGEAKRAGDRVAQALRDQFGDDVNELLWQTTAHYDHIHTSPWPKGWLTPPCDDGVQRIKYRGGTVEYGPFPQTIFLEDNMPTAAEIAQAVWSFPDGTGINTQLALRRAWSGVNALLIAQQNGTLVDVQALADAIVAAGVGPAVASELAARLQA